MSVTSLDCRGRVLDLSRTAVMGILNVTPDSFSDGGCFLARDRALRHAERMVAEGAAIVDIGGESTRPGAPPVTRQEEIDRVVPVVEAVADAVAVPISVDTSRPEVMRAAVGVGAGFVNDTRALRRPGAVQTVAELGVPVCLMHMLGEPRTMQRNPVYQDVVAEVRDYLQARRAECVAAGIDAARIIVDPGFGFGKRYAHNIELLRQLGQFLAIGAPLLVGVSRKSFLAGILGNEAVDRVHASAALALVAAQRGARIVRVHDVAPTVQSLRAWECVTIGDGA